MANPPIDAKLLQTAIHQAGLAWTVRTLPPTEQHSLGRRPAAFLEIFEVSAVDISKWPSTRTVIPAQKLLRGPPVSSISRRDRVEFCWGLVDLVVGVRTMAAVVIVSP
jgi:hypothetical protein